MMIWTVLFKPFGCFCISVTLFKFLSSLPAYTFSNCPAYPHVKFL